MAFEELLDQVGSLGRFHILQVSLSFFYISLAAPHFLMENFAAAIPAHRCWVHILDNDTVSSNDTGILSHDAFLRVFIPLDSHQRPERCRRFIHPQWQLLHLNETFPDTGEPDTEPCMDGWVYDTSLFPSTIVTEWNLVCDYQTLKSVAQVLTMAGGLLGNIISGSASDRFGRKWTVKWSVLLLAVSGTCTAFVPTFLIYCSLRFLAGFTSAVILQNSAVLAVEWTRPQSKATVVTVMYCGFCFGQMILGALAFVCQKWRTLYLVMSIPLFVFFPTSRWLVESARWQIIVNKLDESLKSLKKVADMNGRKTTEETLNVEVVRSTMKEELEAAQTRTTICDLFRTPNIRKMTCILLLLRLFSALPIYGILTNLQHWGNNIFLYQGLCGAIALFSQIFALLVLNRMSCRVSHILLRILGGLSILATIFVPQEMQTLNVTLLSLAMFFSSGAMGRLNVLNSELTPTILRARAAGLNTVFTMLGSTLAPLLMTLVVFSAILPWILYGVTPMIVCLAVFYLPETKNMPLPDTVQDVENKKKIRRKVEKEDSSIKVTKL